MTSILRISARRIQSLQRAIVSTSQGLIILIGLCLLAPMPCDAAVPPATASPVREFSVPAETPNAFRKVPARGDRVALAESNSALELKALIELVDKGISMTLATAMLSTLLAMACVISGQRFALRSLQASLGIAIDAGPFAKSPENSTWKTRAPGEDESQSPISAGRLLRRKEHYWCHWLFNGISEISMPSRLTGALLSTQFTSELTASILRNLAPSDEFFSLTPRIELSQTPQVVLADARLLTLGISSLLACLSCARESAVSLEIIMRHENNDLVIEIGFKSPSGGPAASFTSANVTLAEYPDLSTRSLHDRMCLTVSNDVIRLHGGELLIAITKDGVRQARVQLPCVVAGNDSGNEKFPQHTSEKDATVSAELAPTAAEESARRGRATNTHAIATSATMADRPDLVERIDTIVHANIANPQFGVIELATALHKSRATLNRLVLAETKMSPGKYIREVRLAAAARMLKEVSSITEVAFAVGFESVSGFSRAYHERYGVAPSRETTRSPNLFPDDPSI